ncbi:MAG: HPr family phosphocarrier protein [Bryobacteraceae bacterium]
MFSRTLVIQNRTGFHARPAGLFAETASKYRSTITVRNGNKRSDGKSVLGLMLLGVTAGTEITVEAEGGDESEAVEALAALVAARFGE